MTTEKCYIRIDGELFLIVDERDFVRPATSHDAVPLARTLFDNASMSGRWDLERELGGLTYNRSRLVDELGHRLALGSLKVVREPKAHRLLDAVEIRPLAEVDLPDAPPLHPDTPKPEPTTPTTRPRSGSDTPIEPERPSPEPSRESAVVEIVLVDEAGTGLTADFECSVDGVPHTGVLSDATPQRFEDVTAGARCELRLRNIHLPSRPPGAPIDPEPSPA